MKTLSRIATLLLTFLLLASQVTLPVAAKGQANQPEPHFKDKTTSVNQSHRPYYGKNAVVDIYSLDGITYSTDTVSQQIVEIVPQDIQYKTDATFSEDDLKGQSEKLVTEFLGDQVDLSGLSFSLGKKVGTYFFRWEDTTKKLDDGSLAFIQVGLSANGDFLNLVNTLPFGSSSDTSAQNNSAQRPAQAALPMIGPFNEIYANRNANTTSTYWEASGSMTSVTGGYFYISPASYCTAAYCSKFLYTTGSSSATSTGTWKPNANTKTQASVFVPGTHATARVTYKLNGNSSGTSIDQNSFYNSWVSITISNQASITQISLTNQATIGLEVAWDEAWVYNP